MSAHGSCSISSASQPFSPLPPDAPSPLVLLRANRDAWATYEGTPFQEAGFVAAWEATRGRLLKSETWLLVSSDGTAAMPIEVVPRGLLQIGRFPGETHANANGWTLASSDGPVLTRQNLRAAATAAGIRIDAIDFRRVFDARWLGADFTVTPAFEQRFAISLEGGLEAVLERGNGKRKRKKFRAQQRHFEDRGGYRFRDLPRAERAAALDLFLRQKNERFRALAIPDPFADAGIRTFLIALFEDPATDARLYAIESGGDIKAMLGGIVGQQTFWGMFSSYADDADAAVSPGELLLWHMVERLSQEGLCALDLGPGAERYKQAWCDRTIPQVDATLALTAAGRVYVGAARLLADASRAVKRHEGLKAVVQQLRRRLR